MAQYSYRYICEGWLNHLMNKGSPKWEKELENLREERDSLIEQGYRRWREFRDDLQNRVYEFRKIVA